MKIVNTQPYPAPVTKQDHLDRLRESQSLKWPVVNRHGLANDLCHEAVQQNTVMRFLAKGGELLNVGVIRYNGEWLFLSGASKTGPDLIEHLNQQGWRWAILN